MPFITIFNKVKYDTTSYKFCAVAKTKAEPDKYKINYVLDNGAVFIFRSGNISFVRYADMKIPSKAAEEAAFIRFAVINGGTITDSNDIVSPKFARRKLTVSKRKTIPMEKAVILPKMFLMLIDLISKITGRESISKAIAIPATQPKRIITAVIIWSL